MKTSDKVEEGGAVSAWTEGEALENPCVDKPEVPQWQEELGADDERCLGRTGQSTHKTQNCRKSQSQVFVFTRLQFFSIQFTSIFEVFSAVKHDL